DNRRDTLFHDVFDANKGGAISYSLAIGYKIRVFGKHAIAPFIGYGNDAQLLYLLRDNGNVQGDLKSSYKTKWNGAFAGLDIRFYIDKKLAVTGQISYHATRYSAKADWNLITDFKHPVSFRHDANGYGIVTEAGLTYLASGKLSIVLTVSNGHWTTGKG